LAFLIVDGANARKHLAAGDHALQPAPDQHELQKRHDARTSWLRASQNPAALTFDSGTVDIR
jgi:hypothetical protein